MRISKANQKLQQQLAAQRQVQHFGLRKLSVGVVSVLLSTSLYFGATSVAHAANGTPSVNTTTVTSGVPNKASTATLPEPTASEAPVDDEVDQKIPSSAVGLKDATPGGAPVDDEVDQEISSSAVGLKDATPEVFVTLTAAPDSTAKTTPQYDINDIYNFYHDKKSDISKDRLQKLVDYKNNLASVTAILNLDQTAYGSNWVDQALKKQIASPETFTNTYVDKIISTVSQKLVKDTNQKIDAQLVKLAALQNQYPKNPNVKKAIDELTNAKAMVTPDTILDANRMESVIETLNKYSSQNAYNKLKEEAQQNPNGNNQALDEAKKNAKAAIENLTNLNQAQKEAALAQVKAATTVDAANDYANTAKTLDGAMKDLADTATNADTTSGNYTNADADKQAVLQKAIADAQTLAKSTTEAADADKVAAAKQAIKDAQAALNGDTKLADAKTKAKETINGLTNLNQAQKEAALAQVKAATTVDAANDYANTAKTLDGAMKDLADTATNADTTSGNYTNADADKQAVLQKAIADAQTLAKSTTEAADADKVAAAKQAIKDAQAALNGNDKLAQAKTKAKETINGLKNLNQAQKEAALAQVEAATTVDAANDYANTATTLDGAMKDLADTAAGADTTSGNYTNADADKQAVLQKAIADAQTLAKSTTEAADADKVTAAKQAIEAAQAALNGNDKLAQAKTKAKETINGLKNLNQAQKEAALAQVEAATTVDAANDYANTATTLDGAMKDLADTAAGADTTSGNYTNADADKQAVLQKAIADAQTLAKSTTEAADADKVTAAKQAIEAAQAALNGNDKLAQAKTKANETINGLKNLNQAQKEAALAQVKAATTVDAAKNYATTAITLDDTMGALQKAVTDGNNGKVADPKYYNADATTRAAYDKALSNSQAVLDDANATQAQIDQAKADLSQAAEALTGKATDKSALQATYNQANVAAKTTAYTNANNTIKHAYEKALSEAQAVLADANATQAQVDLAKAALDEIMALLKGASGDATVAKNSSDQSDQNGLSKAATAIDGKNTTSTTSSASKQNQLPQTGAADDASLVAAGLGLTLASMLLGLGAKLKRRQN